MDPADLRYSRDAKELAFDLPETVLAMAVLFQTDITSDSAAVCILVYEI